MRWGEAIELGFQNLGALESSLLPTEIRRWQERDSDPELTDFLEWKKLRIGKARTEI